MKTLFSTLAIVLCFAVHAFGQGFEQLTYPFEMKTVALENGTRIAYTEQAKNDRRTLLFIHGLGSYAPAWKKNIAALAKKYRCVAVDLPGYGKSDKNNDWAYDMSFFAATLRDFVLKQNYGEVVLVGHSMGGQIAMTFAIKYPQLVEKLVLIAPAGLETFSEQEGTLLRNFTKPELVAATPKNKVEENLKANFVTFPDEAQFMLDHRLQMMENEDEFQKYSVAVSKSVAGMLDEPVIEQLGQIRTPTLILFGEEDALIPNRYLHAQLKLENLLTKARTTFFNVRTKVIPEGGHFVNFEQAGEVNKAIRKFVR